MTVPDDDYACGCEFDAVEPDGGESWHYVRTCTMCGCEWDALHCPHDGVQNPCPECGWLSERSRTPMQQLGLAASPPTS